MGSTETITYTLLENGLDFLWRALEYLSNNPTKRDFKYAVLHLSSGVELILKERLRRESWQLIFIKPEEANREAYNSGDFRSVYWKSCIERLETECGIEIQQDILEVLNELRGKRNRIEHFGLIDTETAIKSTTVRVLNFVLGFIKEELDPVTLHQEDIELLKQIRQGVSDIGSFVDHRMQIIEDDLEYFKTFGSIPTCPRCLQDTLIIDDGVSCLFCGYSSDAGGAADEYIKIMLGFDWHHIADGGDWPLFSCPGCEMETLVDMGYDVQANHYRFICFSCGNQWDWESLDECSSCGQFYQADKARIMCDSCLSHYLYKDN